MFQIDNVFTEKMHYLYAKRYLNIKISSFLLQTYLLNLDAVDFSILFLKYLRETKKLFQCN